MTSICMSNRGEICGLIGPNGSGKSTFFDCASGLTQAADAGTVKLDGQDITGWSLNRIAREGRMLRSLPEDGDVQRPRR